MSRFVERPSQTTLLLPGAARCLRLIGIALALSTCLFGCGAEAASIDEPASPFCACKPECPVEVCDLQLEVDKASCGGLVSVVEVLIDGMLEPGVWLPGQPRRTCATVQRGAVFHVTARADTSWLWSPEITCPSQGELDAVNGTTISRVLQCLARKK
jgi:hypothetical protein